MTLQPRDLFFVGVRLIGLWLLIRGIDYWSTVALESDEYFRSYFQTRRAPIFYGCISFIGGFYLMMGAPVLSSVAYPAETSDTSKNDPDSDQ